MRKLTHRRHQGPARRTSASATTSAATIIEMKKRRRIALGDIMTIVFENTDTMRFQIQEMARAERMLTDEQIEHELETYNELIPEARPALGHAVHRDRRQGEALRVAAEARRTSSGPCRSGCTTARRWCRSQEDEERLTREETTTTVHYLKFQFTDEQVAAFEQGPVRIVVDHPSTTTPSSSSPTSSSASSRGDLRA